MGGAGAEGLLTAGARGLPRRLLAGYAVGSLGTAAFATVPGLLLLYYLTDVLAVPAAVASVVLFVAKAWDVVANPLIGTLSDRSAQRRGTRARYLFAGGVLLPPLFALLFAVPRLSSPAAAAYVGGVFVVAATAYALYQVPYIALPAEMTEEPAERTRIMAYRMVLLSVGILVAGGGAPAIVAATGHGRSGYAVMGLAMAAFIAVGMLGSAVAVRRVPAHPHAAHGLSFAAQLRLARGNRPFFVLFGVYVVQALVVGIMLAGEPYVAAYRLGDPDLTTVLFVALIAPAVVVIPGWSAFGRRVGKRAGLVTASAVFGLAALSLSLTLTPGHLWMVGGQFAVLGVCYAGMQLFALSMLPDAIAADEGRSGRRQAGAFSGVWTGGETVAMALGPAVYGAVLVASSFVSSSPSHPVTQPASAITGVLIGFTVIPGVLLLASLPFLRFYRVALPERPIIDAEEVADP
ncbi:MAG: MFS transporter [Streptosporangiaceae bacterium]